MRTTQTLLVLALSHFASAHPAPEVHDSLVARQAGLSLDKLRPQQESDYKASHEVKTSVSHSDYIQAAKNLVKETYPNAEFRQVDDNYVSSSGVGHVNFKQTVFGIDIDNADFSVNVARDGTIFSYGNSFYSGSKPLVAPVVESLLAPLTALRTVVTQLALPLSLGQARISQSGNSFTVQGVPGVESDPVGRLVYYKSSTGGLVPTWKVETDLGDAWLHSYVSALGSAKILAVTNWVSDASYNVFAWPLSSPSSGSGASGNSRTVVQDPADRTASPNGWHNDGTKTYYETRGNNAIAQPNLDGDSNYLNEPRPQSSTLNFNFPFDTTKDPSTYINASTVQLFYTANKYRDILYLLGFNEAAGNFQTNNNGKGGKGNDAVILNTQDGSGTNNANFATPADGSPGRMRMYVWDYTTPKRDSSFDAGVVVHEHTHGLSNRLTGGPANSNCLSSFESGGMGEGWSDFFATALRVKGSDTRTVNYPVGDYVIGKPEGIRAYVYSTSKTTNPQTYSSINGQTNVHAVGAIWATFLYEALWNIIDIKGNTAATTPTLDSKGVPTDGRYTALKIVLDSLALQPCNPTILQSRNAIIDADKALTGGQFYCALWTAFAKRGLGVNASKSGSTAKDDYTLPSGC